MLSMSVIVGLLFLFYNNEQVYGLCGESTDIVCCSLKNNSSVDSTDVKYPCTVCPTCEEHTYFHFISKNKSAYLFTQLSTEPTVHDGHVNISFEHQPGYCVKEQLMEDSEEVFLCHCPQVQVLQFPDSEEIYVSIGLHEQKVLNINAPALQKLYFCKTAYELTIFSSNSSNHIYQISIHYSPIDFKILVNWLLPFTSLRTLNLSHSYFTTPKKIIETITIQSVKNLDLSFCHIEYIDSKTFSVFPQLTHINLSYNKISSISSDSFVPLSELIFISFYKGLQLDNMSLIFHSTKRISMIVMSHTNAETVTVHITNETSSVKVTEKETEEGSDINFQCDTPNCILWMELNISNPLSFKILTEPYNWVKYNTRGYSEYVNNTSIIRSRRSNWVAMERTKTPYKSVIRDPLYYVPITIIVILLLFTLILIFIYCCDAPYFFRRIVISKLKRLSVSSECDGQQNDLFVTFSVGDREWVRTVLKPILENFSVKSRINLHERDQLVGVGNMETEYKSISSCSKWIMILTNDFIQSQTCQNELQLVRSRLTNRMKNFLMLIELETLDTNNIPPYLKQLLSTQTYLEWNLKKFMEESLIDKIKLFLKENVYQMTTNPLLEV